VAIGVASCPVMVAVEADLALPLLAEHALVDAPDAQHLLVTSRAGALDSSRKGSRAGSAEPSSRRT
jgi:hypothetical protein